MRLNRELEDTNRGVVALYAELDEKAGSPAARRRAEVALPLQHEPRVPHAPELRSSPLRLLLGRARTATSPPEQEKQVGFIRKAAAGSDRAGRTTSSTSAKVEAGKIVVRPVEFEVEQPVRRPARHAAAAAGHGRRSASCSRTPADLPAAATPTRARSRRSCATSSPTRSSSRSGARSGSRAALDGRRAHVVFSVADTGIGIARRGPGSGSSASSGRSRTRCRSASRGTGLGLALSRKLAELLGAHHRRGERARPRAPRSGCLAASSTRAWRRPSTRPRHRAGAWIRHGASARRRGQHGEPCTCYDRLLRGTPFQVVSRADDQGGRVPALRSPVRAGGPDIQLAGEDTWGYLARLKARLAGACPSLAVTSADDQPARASLGADAYASKPIEREWRLCAQPRKLTGMSARARHRRRRGGAALRSPRTARPARVRGERVREPEECACALRADRPGRRLPDLVMPGQTGLRSRSPSGLTHAAISRRPLTSEGTGAGEGGSGRAARGRASFQRRARPPQRRPRSSRALARAGWTAAAPPAPVQHVGAHEIQLRGRSHPQRGRQRGQPLRHRADPAAGGLPRDRGGHGNGRA